MGPYKIIRNLGPNVYLLYLPATLGINPIFNVEDLTLHTIYLLVFLQVRMSLGSYLYSPLCQPHTDIEGVLDDEFVSSVRGGFRHFVI